MTEKKELVDLDWKNLGFSYMKTDYRFISHWKEGSWDEGKLVTENTVTISEGSTALHYGQSCFEGLKAYRTKDGRIQLFRPDENAKRMEKSCERLMMPAFPVERFVDAVKQVVRANEAWVPPYESGSTLYIRPYLIGVGDNIGVKPAPEYIFSIFVMPVGPYFKGGLAPTNFVVSDYDRAAPHGTGAAKVGGNYAASLLPGKLATDRHFSDCIYLDPATHTKIEEVGSANFYAITHDDVFVTPDSPSILPSITKYSLLHLAEHYLGLKVEERDVYVDKLDEFKEAGACGTAAVISPIGGIQTKDDFHVFYSETEVGPITQKLYETLTAIQFGDKEGPEGWIFDVNV
ncbi:branched-chain amino acid aminotransferase [Jeotgalibaca ciconiae]|uniref:Branched-chain-amino-acid aminotransferase n=2 Tax=Jeotgalibaca ciconiae TaxID=2496265 RepID=A0A3Q9BNE3_9LACT|nr:branched-chain amino acid aminotransferase [Jeotgalibaca ciconiae]